MFAQSSLFFWLIFMSSMFLVMSCDEWFLVWMGLEVNMISFIALIFSKNLFSVESSMKYFFIQSLGSGLFMMLLFIKLSGWDYMGIMILSYKMGAGPFFFWFPSLCEGVSWGSCFMLMTVQKVLPMVLISMMVNVVLWMIVILSLVIGVLGSMNQVKLKRLMAYSSIHHIGWMLMANIISMGSWFIYLLMYSMMLMGVIFSMWKNKVETLGLLKGWNMKWVLTLGLLSMGGVPPFLGFYLKWWVFYYFVNLDSFMLLFMLVMSVMMLYVYLRILYSVLVGGSETLSWNFFMKNINKMKSMDYYYLMGGVVTPILLLMMV